MAKKLVEAITSMDEDFAQWYTDVVKKAELCGYTSVKGCMAIKPAGYAIWENIQHELDSRFKETGLETEENDNDSKLGAINEVVKFMRDPFGTPYIPGSSLKGAIRTILMNTNPDWNNKKVVDTRGKRPKENKNMISWGAKKGKEFNDLFNAIRVSDSKPFSNESLILVQKWDCSAKSLKVKPLPLYREAIAPLTKVEFTITTTTAEAATLIEKLEDKALEFYKGYKNFFLKDFPEDKIQDNIDYPIYLGAGSGAWTKTIFKQANGIIQDRHKKPVQTKMKGKGVLKLTKAPILKQDDSVQPSKLIKNDESFYEMGKANFMIKEITK